jgi:hypothetical protein
MREIKKVFLSFCDSKLYRSADRIERQAKKMGIYSEIIVANENSLEKSFIDRYSDKLVYGSKGFGYWCWKPQIILQTLKDLDEGDIIQYTDVGCHLNKNGVQRLEYYFKMTQDSNNGILAFEAKIPEYPLVYDGRVLPDLVEYKWTKGDLFDYFGVRNNRKITHSQSMGATVIFIKKCNTSINFIRQWLEVFKSDFSYIDDTPSISSNLPNFVEHRHDQSIFSILCKINAVKTLSGYEYWYPLKGDSRRPNWHELERFPIHAKRDKDLGFLHKVKHLINRILKKIS